MFQENIGRGEALEGSESQDPAAVDLEEELNGPVAKTADAVVQDDEPKFLCQWALGTTVGSAFGCSNGG
jgi:hypothetical protein